MKKNNNIYVHTINGALAFYVDGEQICYLNDGAVIGAKDLKTIHKQQKLSKKWRSDQGFDKYDINDKYGYRRFKINPECLK